MIRVWSAHNQIQVSREQQHEVYSNNEREKHYNATAEMGLKLIGHSISSVLEVSGSCVLGIS